jgi:putative endonuclease
VLRACARVSALHALAGVTLARQQLGKIGEELAVAELERRGYAIVARRYRTRCGEIDIVAEDAGTLVFVEVKARATAEFGTAAEAVTRQKQLKLVAMATDYLARAHIANRPCRFDVVTIDDCETTRRIVVYRNAFDATVR